MNNKNWSRDFISILQALGADIITRNEARTLLRVAEAVRKAGK